MSNTNHLDNLNASVCVTLAGEYLAGTTSSDAEERRVSNIPFSTDKGTRSFLTALASLAVSRERKEVIAVALRTSLKVREVTIFVASNDDAISNATETYIKSIWDATIDISKHLLDVFSSTDHEIPSLSGVPQAQEIGKHVTSNAYRFSAAQLHKRLEKYKDLFNILGDSNIDGLDNSHQTLLNDARTILCAWSEVHKLVDIHGKMRTPTASLDWPKIMEHLNLSWEKGRYLKSQFKSLRECFSQAKIKLNVHRFIRGIQKINGLHAHILHIKQFAFIQAKHKFAQQFSILDFKRIINCLPGRKVARLRDLPTNTWPTGKDGWFEIAKKLLQSTTLSRVLNTSKLEWSNNSELRRHCELTIITHLESLVPSKSVRVIPFIGVSKLCCLPCYTWIQAYNQGQTEGQRDKYEVTGTHSKLYSWWLFPGWVSGKRGIALNRAINNMCSQEMRSYSSNATHVRGKKSDSTAAASEPETEAE